MRFSARKQKIVYNTVPRSFLPGRNQPVPHTFRHNPCNRILVCSSASQSVLTRKSSEFVRRKTGRHPVARNMTEHAGTGRFRWVLVNYANTPNVEIAGIWLYRRIELTELHSRTPTNTHFEWVLNRSERVQVEICLRTPKTDLRTPTNTQKTYSKIYEHPSSEKRDWFPSILIPSMRYFIEAISWKTNEHFLKWHAQ